MSFKRSVAKVVLDLSQDSKGNNLNSEAPKPRTPVRSHFSWSSFSCTAIKKQKPLKCFEDKTEFKQWIEDGNWVLDDTRFRRRDNYLQMRYVCKTSRSTRRCKCDAEIGVMVCDTSFIVYGNDTHSSHRKEKPNHSGSIDQEVFEAVVELKDECPDLADFEIVAKLKPRFPLIRVYTVNKCLKRFKKDFFASSGHNYVWW
ncbi:unnamed protein product [Bursaphelenchus xylophilus]|uniref:(pine wood nematode) hypothetical protein n=1 Tax=Bursaphelenchus xylophilus TaxID=6326 RepID=A0A1I7SHL6_BURXY|nr:unnamed protein product [Bursaphelenchus xylophilus]CAG9083376.1 unnamed protein product [Bursaphelenchus xylophilus]